MADTVQITAGAGTVIGTDDVTIGATTQHVQRVKLVDGTDGGTELLAGSASRGLCVDPRLKVVRLSVTPAISTAPAYAAKDAVGGLMTFAGAARAAGGSCWLDDVQIIDKSQQRPDLDLVLFDRAITAPTDNAVFAPTDTEVGYAVAVIEVQAADWKDFSTNAVGFRGGLRRHLLLNGTDLCGVLVAQTTPTFVSTSDLVVTLTISQD